MRKTPVEDYLEEISTSLSEETYGRLLDAIYDTNCDFDDELAAAEERGARLAGALKALMAGTYAELCASRDAAECRRCGMRHGDAGCAVTDAMGLLGCDMHGDAIETAR